MEGARQVRSIAINRGLFLVRYAASEDKAQPPVVKVSAAPGSSRDIELLLHPDHDEAVLTQPNSCLVVRALVAGKLSVEVVPSAGSASTGATVRIEPLIQGAAAPPPSHPKGRSGAPYDFSALHIISHVTGIGDRRVKVNEWVAGPAAPSRIEGFAIEWPDKPRDLGVHYAVKTAKPLPGSSRAVGLGAFAGTRGQAMPIVGVMLELSGKAAAAVQFVVDALFLGAPTTHMVGRHIIISGPTGREPLVGLRMALQNVEKSQSVAASSQPISVGKPAARPAKTPVSSPTNIPLPAQPEHSLPPRPRTRRRPKSNQPAMLQLTQAPSKIDATPCVSDQP
jgi:hypothetical protein